MSFRARSYVFVTIALLVTSLALLGCPKRPEVSQAGPGAVGPSAATVPSAGPQAGTQGGEVPVTRVPPPAESQVSPAPSGAAQGGAAAVAPSAPTPSAGGPAAVAPGAGAPVTAGSGGPGVPPSPVKDVFFDFDKFSIRDDQKAPLSEDVAWLKQNARTKVTVEGHCDERGSSEYNLALGERRAKAVKDYLVAAGVPGDRISIVSYGEERPFVLGHDESAWKWNRRGHFVISGQ